MKIMLAEEMDAGALGLSTGFGIRPGYLYSSLEVVALASVAASKGSRYISHIRVKTDTSGKPSMKLSALAVLRGYRVQISHGKAGDAILGGKSAELMARLDSARSAGVEITADVYPYTYWHSSMTVLFLVVISRTGKKPNCAHRDHYA